MDVYVSVFRFLCLTYVCMYICVCVTCARLHAFFVHIFLFCVCVSADDHIAWYAVGCYDLLLRRHAQARRFFSKATSLKPNLVTALIAFGHTFAEKDEHEQVSSPQFFFV